MKFFCIPSSLFACKNGIVEQSDFSQLKLESVPKEIIKSRKYIEELLLNVNSIEELPPDLFRCTKIRKLDVSENKIKVIPTEIGMLSSLEELNLSKNEIVEIPEEIGYCQNLVCLDISTNILTGFPKSFVDLTNLASLNLSNNSITHLPADIDHLVNLQFLDIAQCELRALPPSIVRLRFLKVLDLCDNYLTDLPSEMGGLVSLEMLDLHCNMVSHLPESLLNCGALRSLDMSGNQLNELPANIGDLKNLMELTICENQIRQLPSSIGQLKRLESLKCAKNCLSELTPSICSCVQLTDLILCENRLNLRFLDVNVNNLRSIPSTIGGCSNLTILSLRHNQINELPMEIGRLNSLQVLDLIDNNLKYLPYTLTCLYKAKTLSALWLSFNQPSLPKLSTINEPIMNIKVLTCYLLPQQEQPQKQSSQNKSSSCVGGARVCFAGDRAEEFEEDKIPIGKFERYDTPHPKPFAPKNRNRNSTELSVGVIPNGSSRSEKSETQGISGNRSNDQAVAEESRPLRSVLKRRPQSVLSLISTSELLPALLGGNQNSTENGDTTGMKMKKSVRKNIQLKKGDAGFQWTIVGGSDSLPYKGKNGLFISQLVPGGVSEKAGFRVDDQLLAVNGDDIRGLSHFDVVKFIQNAGNILEFLVERDQIVDDQMQRSTFCLATQQISANSKPNERHSFRIIRDGNGCVPFTVSGNGRWPQDPFSVSAIKTSVECPLLPGDRIISIDGTNVKFGVRLDQVRTLLTGLPGTNVTVGIERGNYLPDIQIDNLQVTPLACSTAFSELSLSRSLPSLCVVANEMVNNNQQQQTQKKPIINGIPSVPKNKNISQLQQHHFNRHSSLRNNPTTAFSASRPPLPLPRHHRSLSNLTEIDGNKITPEMLRSSTPIEYPPGEEPKIFSQNNSVNNENKQQKQQMLPSQIKSNNVNQQQSKLIPVTTANSTNFSSVLPPSPAKILSSPTNDFVNRTSFSPTQKATNYINNNGFSTKSSRQEKPLATSTPIPPQEISSNLPQIKSSHIPKPMTNIIPSIIDVGNSKIPPPIAPKPKVC
uniref:PDZ domain-containing protein n=1 Tax=Meloidogyne hapla TaxID=6305 RepID=A0A1I8B7U7_MELHA